MNDVERDLAAMFHREGHRQGRCQQCGWKPGPDDGPWLEVDHALPVSVMRVRFRQIGPALPAAVRYDVRNARLLCCEPAPERCHGRWTNRCFGYAPPPIREAVREFARELDVRFAVNGAEPFSAWVDATYGPPGGTREAA